MGCQMECGFSQLCGDRKRATNADHVPWEMCNKYLCKRSGYCRLSVGTHFVLQHHTAAGRDFSSPSLSGKAAEEDMWQLILSEN